MSQVSSGPGMVEDVSGRFICRPYKTFALPDADLETRYRPWLLLVPGIGSPPQLFWKIMQQAGEKGITCIAQDVCAYHDCSTGDPPPSFHTTGNAVVPDQINEMVTGARMSHPSGLTIAGHSLATRHILQYLMKGVQNTSFVNKIAFLAPAYAAWGPTMRTIAAIRERFIMHLMRGETEKIIQDAIDLFAGDDVASQTKDFYEKNIRRFPLRLYAELLLPQQLWQQRKKFSHPTLVLDASNDRLRPGGEPVGNFFQQCKVKYTSCHASHNGILENDEAIDALLSFCRTSAEEPAQ